MLIGPTAGQVDAIGINGERSMGLVDRQVGPLDAMKRLSGNNAIRFAVADDMTGAPIPASAFSHDGQPGLAYSGPGGVRSRPPAVISRSKIGNALAANTAAELDGAP